jgi:hypothetical protein
MEKSKSFLIHAVEGCPGYEFIQQMCKFIKRPEMIDGEWESSPLKLSGRNLIHSLVLVGSLITILSGLLKGLDIIDFPRIINPIYLTLNLAIQSIIFAGILLFVVTIVSVFKKVGSRKLYFMQVLQTYSVINFFVVCLFWIAMQWLTVSSIQEKELSLIELAVGGCLAVVSMGLAWWLLVMPIAKYLSLYYSKRFAWALTLVIIVLTSQINQLVHFGFNDYLINKTEFCEYFYKVKSKSLDTNGDKKACIIGNCIEKFKM